VRLLPVATTERVKLPPETTSVNACGWVVMTGAVTAAPPLLLDELLLELLELLDELLLLEELVDPLDVPELVVPDELDELLDELELEELDELLLTVARVMTASLLGTWPPAFETTTL
jgi:hypothetical protein